MSSPERRRVLYNSVYPLGSETDGGQLACREHVMRLASGPHVELHVCTVGHKSHEPANKRFVEALGAKHYHIPLYAVSVPMTRGAGFTGRARWPFPTEPFAVGQRHVDLAFKSLANAIQPDVVVMDYLFSALFIPSVFDLDTRRILVTLNNEAEFFADQCRHGRNDNGTSRSFMAQWRLARYQRAVCSKCDEVVGLSGNDFPRDISNVTRTRILQPVLDASPMRWSPTGEANLFFVGNLAHYPNFLAIKWLAEDFAPALAELMPVARIRIVGAADGEVAAEWRRSNIDFLGKSDAETVKTLFATSALFIAPIENAFGSKMKVLQCLSHATPVLASAAALSGLPFDGVIPLLRLEEPRAAAEAAKRLMSDPRQLEELSVALEREHAAFVAGSERAWDELIVATCRAPRRRAPARGLASAIDWLLDVPDSIRRPGYSFGIAEPSKILRAWRNLRGATEKPVARALEVAVVEPPGVEYTGLYPIELVRGELLRWTSEGAEIKLPIEPNAAPRAIRLSLWPLGPPGGTNVTVTVNGAEALSAHVNGRRILREVPLPALDGASTLVIRLESPGFQFNADSRRLGVALAGLTLIF